MGRRSVSARMPPGERCMHHVVVAVGDVADPRVSAIEGASEGQVGRVHYTRRWDSSSPATPRQVASYWTVALRRSTLRVYGREHPVSARRVSSRVSLLDNVTPAHDCYSTRSSPVLEGRPRPTTPIRSSSSRRTRTLTAPPSTPRWVARASSIRPQSAWSHQRPIPCRSPTTASVAGSRRFGDLQLLARGISSTARQGVTRRGRPVDLKVISAPAHALRTTTSAGLPAILAACCRSLVQTCSFFVRRRVTGWCAFRSRCAPVPITLQPSPSCWREPLCLARRRVDAPLPAVGAAGVRGSPKVFGRGDPNVGLHHGLRARCGGVRWPSRADRTVVALSRSWFGQPII